MKLCMPCKSCAYAQPQPGCDASGEWMKCTSFAAGYGSNCAECAKFYDDTVASFRSALHKFAEAEAARVAEEQKAAEHTWKYENPGMGRRHNMQGQQEGNAQ